MLPAREILVECDNLSGPGIRSNFRDEVIGKSHTTFAGSIQSPARQVWRLNRYTARLKQTLDGVQDSFPIPLATENPRQFGKHQEGHKYTGPGTSLRQSGPRSGCLIGIVVQICPRPDVGIRREHYHFLRTLAAFISLKVMRIRGLAPRSAILHKSSRS